MSKLSRNILNCLILTVFLALGGCSIQRQIPSTNIRLIKKDSLVIHTDLVSIPIPRERENNITNNRKSHLETSVAYSDAEIDSLGLLHHTLSNKEDSLKKEIQYIDRIQVRDSIIIKEVQVPVEVEKEVKYIPKVYLTTFYICIIEFLLLICYLLYRFKIFKLFKI